jgi:hypothetical protein
MAADLHDFVGHHVTGILIQTQMARMMVSSEPDRLDPVLAGIEHAATEALGSMRLTVGILRDGPEQTARLEPGESRPLGDLTALAELVDGFGGPTVLRSSAAGTRRRVPAMAGALRCLRRNRTRQQ